MAETIRPTKKQRELLTFIENFISEHGYSPSYREIMSGAGYSSVATVALHINSLIKRGHIAKRDNSARSLEVLKTQDNLSIKSNEIKPAEEKWLVEKTEFKFANAERQSVLPQEELDQLYVLIGALKVLGLDGAAQSFIPRLGDLKKRVQ